MIILPADIDGLRTSKAHRFAILWRIQRLDGVNILLTDHDTKITFNVTFSDSKFTNPLAHTAGTDEVYTPVDSLVSSASQKQAGLKQHNVDVSGVVISSGQITEDDLRAGKYREATIYEILIDWRWPQAGYFYKNVYYIDALSYTREVWQAQLSGVPVYLRREVGSVYDYTCRFTVYDNNCQAVQATFSANGTVTTVTDPNRSFIASGTTVTDNLYTDGPLLWNTGNNAGTQAEVMSQLGTNFTVFLNEPKPIQVGDTFTVAAGCDRTAARCQGVFNNFSRFGGFPFLPGNDALIATPRGN